MSVTVASLVATIGADTRGFEAGSKKVKSGMTSLGSTFSQILPPGIAQFASLSGAVLAAGSAMKFAIDQAAESEMVDAKLNAVLESTGGAAGLAADELNKMAESLSKVSIYDDEAIKSSEALLLTFTNIGRNVFPEAEQAILDMSSALGQDLQSSTIQLGKALNDPIKGITALSRAGVSFTQQQKDMIKVLVDSGDTLGAQKIILAELNKEFGGQAAAAASTYAGQMAQLKNEMGNLGEVIGTDLLPDLVFLVKELKGGVEWITKNYEAIKKWGNIVLWVTNPLMQLSKIAGKGLKGIFEDADDSVDSFGTSAENAAGSVEQFAPAIEDSAAALDAQKEAVKAAEQALKDYENQLEAVSQANLDMESMSRDIAESQKNYAEDHAAAMAALAQATKEGSQEGIAEAQGKIQELEATWHESAQNMIYDMILVGLSAGGLLDSEQKALDDYAVKAGIKTQADIDEANRRREIADATIAGILQSEDVLAEQRKVDAETLRLQTEITSQEKLTAAGNEAAAMSRVSAATRLEIAAQTELARAAGRTAAAYRSIPNSGGSNSGGSSGGGGGAGRRDSGGPGIAGTPYIINPIAAPEVFIPSSNGTFVPNADKKGLLGGGDTINIYITNPKREAAEDSVRRELRNIIYTRSAS